MSGVLDYLQTVYKLSCSSGGHSWQVINSAMSDALNLAIRARFPFEKEDFTNLCRPDGGWPDNGYLGWTRWFSESGERFYSLAIESRNISAAIAFETWKGRKPFIFQKQRLYVGSRFELAPKQFWYCNSFAEDGTYINCGSYTTAENPVGWQNNSPTGKGPVKRLKLTVKELKEQERANEQDRQS